MSICLSTNLLYNLEFGNTPLTGFLGVITMMQVYIPSNQKVGHIKELNDDGVVESYASCNIALHDCSLKSLFVNH